MSKRLLYMIVLAFILQMTWGVASAYCMHESGKASQHFGHHQHQHQSEAAGEDEDNAPPVKKSASHPDCASCLHGSLALFTWPADFILLLLTDQHLHSTLPIQPSPYLGLPERPQWQAAAYSGVF